MSSVDYILDRSDDLHKTIAVTAAADSGVLEAVRRGQERGIVDPILIGDAGKIREVSEQIGFVPEDADILNSGSPEETVKLGMELVRQGRADILMKGLINTRDFLKVVLDKSYGLCVSGILAHLALFFPEFYSKPVLVSDAGLNLFPSYEDKLLIMHHGIEVLHGLGVERPRVAVLAHNEISSEKVPASMDAVRLVAASRRGELPQSIVEGPMSLDLALNLESCEQKGVESLVGGQADMLLCPDILSGNILYKCMTVIGKAPGAAFIAGGAAPIVLTSRGDTTQTKLLSIAFAAVTTVRHVS